MGNKIYYYLKLEEGFFRNKIIRALRKLPGGSDLVICYLKMQLTYISTEGFIKYAGIYETIEEEIAEEIEETTTNVQMTVAALKKWNCLEYVDNSTIYLSELQERIGQKSEVALRVAKHREKIKALQSNNNVTNCNSCVTICNNDVTPQYYNETKYRDREEIELDKEIEKSKIERNREDSMPYQLTPLPFTQYLIQNAIIENDNFQIAKINSDIRFYKGKFSDEILKNIANRILEEIVNKGFHGDIACNYFSDRFEELIKEESTNENS